MSMQRTGLIVAVNQAPQGRQIKNIHVSQLVLKLRRKSHDIPATPGLGMHTGIIVCQ